MSENKNPYQIRQELLSTAKEYVESTYHAQLEFVHRQFQLAEELIQSNETEGRKLFENTTKNLESFSKNYPTVDNILAVAKQFQDFVDNKS